MSSDLCKKMLPHTDWNIQKLRCTLSRLYTFEIASSRIVICRWALAKEVSVVSRGSFDDSDVPCRVFDPFENVSSGNLNTYKTKLKLDKEVGGGVSHGGRTRA